MAPPARLLDLSRLAGRAARVLTGVDRVERAYLAALAGDGVPAYGLIRTSVGYLLLDRGGLHAFVRAIDAQSWPAPRLFDRIARRGDTARAGVEGFLRHIAIARCTRRGLAAMLVRHLPPGLSYVNVGQTSLRADVLAAVRRIPGSRVAVMIHDTIPLDHPDWQRPGTVAQFATRLRLAQDADTLLCNSHAVAAACRQHMARVPQITVAHLGVDLAPADAGALPPGLDLSRPWFVSVNTIEPRKNHALLLDVWAMLGPDAPHLFIIGARGWMNAGVFDRLDARPTHVTELTGLSDGAVAALVAGARAALNPSFAEGFGLPALEAAGRGVPVVCGDLAIWHELLGNAPVYLDLHDRYQWKNTVEEMARSTANTAPLDVPTWPQHFKTVLTAV